MGRHLKVDLWFDQTSTGTLRRKRVSAEREKQFPIGYRKLYQRQGLVALIRYLRQESATAPSLHEAWTRTKTMFNGE
jgi:hypothetical protein